MTTNSSIRKYFVTMIPDIRLNPDEQALFDQIILDPLLLKSSDQAQKNGETVFELIQSLIERKAIPYIRIRYFTDREFNIGGRGRSKQEVFEKNGTSGEEIYRHPHFLYFLSYFLFGPNLPLAVKDGFQREVTSCGPITSGDILTLASWTKQSVRTFGLDPGEAQEEFFKLGIECGINSSYAAFIVNGLSKLKTLK